MPSTQQQSNAFGSVLELLTQEGFEGMAQAMEILVNEAMKIERSDFMKALPYQRSESRRGRANGFKEKLVKTRVGALKCRVPQVRDVPSGEEGFYPSSLEKGVRSERALKAAVAEMYVQGVSTRKVAEITQELCGLDVSSAQVSNAVASLDGELSKWRERPLGEVPYVLVDARYEKVRHGGSVVDGCVLIAIGVLPGGKRTILGTSTSLSEAEVHWRDFFESLLARGLHGVKLIASDHHSGLGAARKRSFPTVPWQRCQFHLQQNASAYVPKVAQRKDAARDIRDIFNAPDRQEAERLLQMAVKRWSSSAPRLAAWMEESLPDGFTVFEFPPTHRRRLRTTNLLENLNKQIKRRTRVATLFPNHDSLLRLVSAVLIEVSEEWETGRKYLNMEQQ